MAASVEYSEYKAIRDDLIYKTYIKNTNITLVELKFIFNISISTIRKVLKEKDESIIIQEKPKSSECNEERKNALLRLKYEILEYLINVGYTEDLIQFILCLNYEELKNIEIQSLYYKIKNLEIQLKKKNVKINALLTNCQQLQEAYNKLKSKKSYTDLNSDEIKKIICLVKELQAKNLELESSNKNFSNIEYNYIKKIKFLENENNSLKQDIISLKSTSNRYVSLLSEHSILKNRYNEQFNELSDFKSKFESLLKKYEELKRSKESIEFLYLEESNNNKNVENSNKPVFEPRLSKEEKELVVNWWNSHSCRLTKKSLEDFISTTGIHITDPGFRYVVKHNSKKCKKALKTK